MKVCLTIFQCFILCSIFGQGQTVGLFALEADQAYEAFTLYAPLESTDTYLINNCGQVINQWPSEFTPGTAAYLDDQAHLWRTGTNRVDNEFRHSGTGGFLQRIDWSGELLWQAELPGAHHDFHIMPNGNILYTAWEKIDRAFLLSLGFQNTDMEEFWSEVVYEIAPSGSSDYELIWEWHAIDHIVQSVDPSLPNFISSPSPRRIDVNIPGDDDDDWLHINSIDYDEQNDQILLSVRNLNEIWVIDHSTTIEEASSSEGGQGGFGGDLLFRFGNELIYNDSGETLFDGQHNARFLDDRISLFDNGRTRMSSAPVVILPELAGDGSYILDSTFMASIDSSYVDLNMDFEFDSPILSSFEILPNGNLLICSGNNTRIYELNSDLELVWHYRGTVSLFGPIEQGSGVIGSTFNVSKYAVDDFRFDGLDVSVKAPSIEINPLNLDCRVNATKDEDAPLRIPFYYAEGFLRTASDVDLSAFDFSIHIYNSLGQQMVSNSRKSTEIDLRNLESGFYFAVMVDSNARTYSFPFVKN